MCSASFVLHARIRTTILSLFSVSSTLFLCRQFTTSSYVTRLGVLTKKDGPMKAVATVTLGAKDCFLRDYIFRIFLLGINLN